MSAITRIDLPSVWHGAAMARHGRRLSPAPAARPVRFFTKHESRNTNHGFFRNTAFLPRRQARRLQGGMYEARENEWKGVFSESRDRNNDFYRIPTRFTTRYIPQYPTMRRIDSDKPLPPIKRLRARRPVAALLRVVARHGAAMARHGRHIAPEPLSPLPSAVRRSSRRPPGSFRRGGRNMNSC